MAQIVQATLWTPSGEFLGTVPGDAKLGNLSWVSPGGCGEFSWSTSIGPPFFGRVNYREGTRVDVFDTYGLTWRGRLEKAKVHLSSGRADWTFSAYGFMSHLHDLPYETSKTFALGTPLEGVFRTVRSELLPLISSSDVLIGTTRRSLQATTEDYLLKYPADVYADLSRLGDVGGNRVLYHFWPGAPGATEKPVLEVAIRPTVPAYYVNLADGAELDLEGDLQRLANRVIVTYGASGSSSIPADDLDSQAAPPVGYGFRRTRIVSIAQLGAGDANVAAVSLKSRLGEIKTAGTQLTIPASCPVEGPDGSQIPHIRVRPGQLIEVKDLRAGAVDPSQYQFFLAQVTWDDATETISATLEQPAALESVIGGLIRERLPN